MIEPIVPEYLSDEFLRDEIYPDLERTFYWSRSWDPDFYIALARAGFITIGHRDPDLGYLLLPEIQAHYAVLDWENLHASRNLKRLMRSDGFAREDVVIRVADPDQNVIERLVEYHAEHNWIHNAYRRLVRALPTNADPNFSIHGIELWSRARNELIAGELGYSIGRIYTSLSGFSNRNDPEWRHFGTLQLYLLAERLRESGYAFWNLGHPHLTYKTELGARVLPRKTFLERWLEVRNDRPSAMLTIDPAP